MKTEIEYLKELRQKTESNYTHPVIGESIDKRISKLKKKGVSKKEAKKIVEDFREEVYQEGFEAGKIISGMEHDVILHQKEVEFEKEKNELWDKAYNLGFNQGELSGKITVKTPSINPFDFGCSFDEREDEYQKMKYDLRIESQQKDRELNSREKKLEKREERAVIHGICFVISAIVLLFLVLLTK